MSALGRKADMCSAQWRFRFTPESGHSFHGVARRWPFSYCALSTPLLPQVSISWFCTRRHISSGVFCIAD